MLTAIFTFMIGLFGAALISFGAWMVFPPAGVIAAGLFCLLASYFAARAAAPANDTPGGN